MHGTPLRVKSQRLSDALARAAYAEDRFRLVHADLSGFDCLVASRQGLFAAARTGAVELVAWGYFFGIRHHHQQIYLFEACDHPRNPSAMGRIVRIAWRDGQLTDPRILVRGLDNNCHQIAIIDDLLCVVDTANQQILRFALNGEPVDRKQPIGVPASQDDLPTYRHINSIAEIDGRIGLMLHNGRGDRHRPSELVWLDKDWRIVERSTLAGHGCHDIVAGEDGTVWHCGSMAGELISSKGNRVSISEMMTRGLAKEPSGFVVGYSQFGIRWGRELLAGGLAFLSNDFEHLADVQLKGAPTDLIMLSDLEAGFPVRVD